MLALLSHMSSCTRPCSRPCKTPSPFPHGMHLLGDQECMPSEAWLVPEYVHGLPHVQMLAGFEGFIDFWGFRHCLALYE